MATVTFNKIRPATQPRKEKVILTEDEKFAVATYCIENMCVTQDESGDFTKFRVKYVDIAAEVYAKGVITRAINTHQVKQSVEFFTKMTKLLNAKPQLVVRDDVQSDMLKAENAKLIQRIEELEAHIKKVEEAYKNNSQVLYAYDALHKNLLKTLTDATKENPVIRMAIQNTKDFLK